MKKSAAYTASLLTAAVIAYALRKKPRRLGPGHVALITGGSRGLGLAMAHEFGRAGMKLALVARNQEELEKARGELIGAGHVTHEDDIQLIVADLTDTAQAEGIVEQTIRAFGRLDLLVNNAGIIEVGPYDDQPVENYYKSMELIFFAALHTVKAAVPHMAERGSGAIVNISSIGGKVPVPHLLPYVAAKFALTGFSEGLHIELRQKGILVTTVCPGLMRSGGEEHAKFRGQKEKEAAWFKLSAKTPGLSADVHHAARVIADAVQAGRTEITITPQAALAARVFGLAPSLSQDLAAIINEHGLPDPLPPGSANTEENGAAIPTPGEAFADPSPS